MAKLTDKQQLFVQEYLIDLNATQAAIRAGYSGKTAYSVGHENLRKPDIEAAIQSAQKEAAKRTKVTVDGVYKMYRDAFDVAKDGNQPSAMVSAANGVVKLYGLDAETRAKINDDQDTDSPTIPISYEVSPAVSDVKVTNAKPIAK